MAKRYTVYLKMHVRDMKKESQQIKKLKKQLSEIQTLAKIGSWEWDKKTNKVEWSNMMYILLGYKPNSIEPSYRLALSHVHEDDKYKYVKDEGEGIEEKDHESIFGRFKQIENQYSRTNTAQGLDCRL